MIKDKVIATINYTVKGVKFETQEEAIAVLKNDPNQTMDDFYHFFSIPIIQYDRFNKQGEERFAFFKEVNPDTNPEEFYSVFEHFDIFIPQISKEQVKTLVDSIQPMTKKEIKERYATNSEQYKMAMSYLKLNQHEK